jgi:FMN phosphatase YigB (HAD superfamily)
MTVFLDIGSTLLDGPPAGPAKRIAGSLGLGKESLPAIERLLFCTAVRDADELGQRLGHLFGVDSASAVDSVTALWNAQLQEAYALPGALEAIAGLKAAGIPRAYLSNIWPPFYARFEREFADEARGQPQFLSFQMGIMKPDPEIFRRALDSAGVSPGDAVMVGDTYNNDIMPAIALGMRTVWILHRPDKEKAALVRVVNREAPAPDLTLAAIGDLRPALLRPLTDQGLERQLTHRRDS